MLYEWIYNKCSNVNQISEYCFGSDSLNPMENSQYHSLHCLRVLPPLSSWMKTPLQLKGDCVKRHWDWSQGNNCTLAQIQNVKLLYTELVRVCHRASCWRVIALSHEYAAHQAASYNVLGFILAFGRVIGAMLNSYSNHLFTFIHLFIYFDQLMW